MDIGTSFSDFEQKIALSWAQVCFQDWLSKHQAAPVNERVDHFFDCIEGGLSVALEYRHKNRDR